MVLSWDQVAYFRGYRGKMDGDKIFVLIEAFSYCVIILSIFPHYTGQVLLYYNIGEAVPMLQGQVSSLKVENQMLQLTSNVHPVLGIWVSNWLMIF